MGRRCTLALDDSAGRAWIGEHRPELVDLSNLFQGIVELTHAQASEPESWRNVLPEGVMFLRLIGTTTAHVRVRGGEVSDVVVKILAPSSAPSLVRWAETLRHSRAQRTYLWAHRLRAVGIEAPRPLGFIERRHQPALAPSVAVTEYVLAPTLIEFRDTELAELAGSQEGAMRKRLVIQQLGALFRGLSAAELFPDGLGPEHFAVANGTVWLRAFGTDPSPLRRRGDAVLDAMIRIYSALPPRALSRADRIRFLHELLRHSSDLRAALRSTLGRLEKQRQYLADREVRVERARNLGREPPPALEKQA